MVGWEKEKAKVNYDKVINEVDRFIINQGFGVGGGNEIIELYKYEFLIYGITTVVQYLSAHVNQYLITHKMTV